MRARQSTIAAAIGLGVFAAGARAQDPQGLADALTGGAPAGNPQCRLFTTEEIAAYLGAPVASGGNAGMGMGCQWLAQGDAGGDAMVMVVPADYAERPSLAPGFVEAPEIGPDAFVVPELGGWAAGATAGADFVKVSLAGSGASAERVVAFLREALARRGG